MAVRASRGLAATLLFVLGIAVGALYPPVTGFVQRQWSELAGFVAGHPLEEPTTAWQKIQNDLGLAPWRETRDGRLAVEFDWRALRPAAGLEPLFPESVLELYTAPGSPALEPYSGMLVKTQVSGARGYGYQLLLLGFDGVVHKAIPLGTRRDCRCDATRPLNYFHVAGDPSELRSSGNALVRVNGCGGIDWRVPSRYSFHHYLNSDGDHARESFWVLDATDLVQIESASGTVRQRIALGEIVNANPDLPVFEARLHGTRADRWAYGDTEFTPLDRTHTRVSHADHNPFHTNDIDAYDGPETGLFRRGDLALSLRSLNLVAVVRPATRRIVWYASGLTSRQHDPDFLSADSIAVYDNNFHNEQSRIVLLEAGASGGNDPAFTVRRRTLLEDFEGRQFQQLTGGYQFFLDNGRRLVFTANHYNAGVDLADRSVFLALRHRWRDDAFLNLEIERLLEPAEFDAIRAAACR